MPSYSVNVRFSTRWFATAVPITFTPSVLSFQNGGPLCQNFTFQATENPLSTNSFNLVFTLDGPSALWFNAPNLPKIITVVSRSVQVYTPSSTWQLGLTQTISISVNYPPSTWIDVEVYAPEIQFNVSKVTLTSSQPYAELQGTPYTIGTNVAIRNFVGGPDGGWYTTSTVFLNSISFRTIEIQRIYTAAEIQYYPNMIQTTNNFTLNYPDVLPTVFTVVLSAPVTNSLTIQPTATQLSFVPSTLTLSPGATTMQFQVRGFTGGVHTTNFILSGPDAPYYSNIQGPIQFTVVKGGLTPYYTLSAASFVSTNVSLILSLTIFLLFNLF